jgi:hypothetical protein
MRELVPFLGQGLVVIGPCPLRVEREVELVFLAELEARLGQGLVPEVGPRVTLGVGEVPAKFGVRVKTA